MTLHRYYALSDPALTSSTPLLTYPQLLQLGCSADKMNPSPWGGSALHEAVAGLLSGPACPRQAAHLVETINLLLERGADPCLENAAGLTAMDMLQGRKPDPGAAAAAAGAGAAARSGGAGGGLLGLGGGLSLGRMLSVLQRAGSRRHASLLRAMEARAALTCCAARMQVGTHGRRGAAFAVRRRTMPYMYGHGGVLPRCRAQHGKVTLPNARQAQYSTELLACVSVPGLSYGPRMPMPDFAGAPVQQPRLEPRVAGGAAPPLQQALRLGAAALL